MGAPRNDPLLYYGISIDHRERDFYKCWCIGRAAAKKTLEIENGKLAHKLDRSNESRCVMANSATPLI